MLNLFLQLYFKYSVLIAKLKTPLLQGTEEDTINLRSRKAKTYEISNKYTHRLPNYSLVVCDILLLLYGPFLWMEFNCLKARATSRRQFRFIQPSFTCSKLTIETLEQGAKYVQR